MRKLRPERLRNCLSFSQLAEGWEGVDKGVGKVGSRVHDLGHGSDTSEPHTPYQEMETMTLTSLRVGEHIQKTQAVLRAALSISSF